MKIPFTKKRRRRIKNEQTKQNIIRYYEQLNQLSDEEKKVIHFLKHNNFHPIPYDFIKEGLNSQVSINWDKKVRLYYVIWEGKKLYFNQKKRQKIANYYRNLIVEQHPDSPHRYLTSDFNVCENDVVVDIGAAEGNFSLSVADLAKKVYLFETEEKWIKPLKATFDMYNDKVQVVQKYVSDMNSNEHVTLESFFKNMRVDFLKIDVEGAEQKVLIGAREILESKQPLKIAICAYHKPVDLDELTNILSNYGFSISLSDGYMIYNPVSPPYLRKGVIRAVRY